MRGTGAFAPARGIPAPRRSGAEVLERPHRSCSSPSSISSSFHHSAARCPRKLHPTPSRLWGSRNHSQAVEQLRDLEVPRSLQIPLQCPVEGLPAERVDDQIVCAIPREKFPFGPRPLLSRPSGD